MALPQTWRIALLFALSFLLILVGSILGADIVGPESVPAGSGLVRLVSDTPEGTRHVWVPITPRDLDYVQLPDGIVFAASCSPSRVEVQLIEVTDLGDISIAFHEVTIGDPQPNPDPDPDPGPDPPPPEKLVVLIIEETQVRKPGFGDELVKLRRWADTQPHTLLIFDEDTAAAQLAAYATGDSRPLLVIDEDLDAGNGYEHQQCPETAEDIIQRIKSYTSAGSAPARGDVQEGPKPADTDQSVVSRFEVVMRNGGKFARDTRTGKLHIIVDGKFTVGGKRYQVEKR